MKALLKSQLRSAINKDIEAKRYSYNDLLLSLVLAIKSHIELANPKEVVILCGNNHTGDAGLMLADLLYRKSGISVKVIHFSVETRLFGKIILNENIEVINSLKEVQKLFEEKRYVVDCLFSDELEENIYYPYGMIIDWVNNSNSYVISYQCNSGINGDTGEVLGKAIRSDVTITAQADKPGFYLSQAINYVGKVIVEPVGVSMEAMDEISCDIFTDSDDSIVDKLPKRFKHSHKGTYGKVLVIGGCKQTAGAALLASRSALTAGAGLLTVLTYNDIAPQFNELLPEAMILTIDESNIHYQLDHFNFNNFDTILIGPGLSRNTNTEVLLQYVLKTDKTVIIDADGLFYLKKYLHLLNREALTVITPHLVEYKRVFAYNQDTVVEDLRRISNLYPSLIIVLKGEHTLIANKGIITINKTGNNALAKGGSGDVLAGTITGFLAQKKDYDSVVAGVYVHSLAADYWVKDYSPYSLLASDLIRMIDRVLFNFTNKGK